MSSCYYPSIVEPSQNLVKCPLVEEKKRWRNSATNLSLSNYSRLLDAGETLEGKALNEEDPFFADQMNDYAREKLS